MLVPRAIRMRFELLQHSRRFNLRAAPGGLLGFTPAPKLAQRLTVL